MKPFPNQNTSKIPRKKSLFAQLKELVFKSTNKVSDSFFNGGTFPSESGNTSQPIYKSSENTTEQKSNDT